MNPALFRRAARVSVVRGRADCEGPLTGKVGEEERDAQVQSPSLYSLGTRASGCDVGGTGDLSSGNDVFLSLLGW